MAVFQLTRSGIRSYAERRGHGPALLFISGTGGDLATHPNGFDLPFAGSFDLACYDQRGLGRSDEPGPGAHWSMADYADDAAAVLDWAGWPAAAVIGVSFGGMVAQELLLRHPGRVSRAVLACTSSGGAGGASFPLDTLAGLPAAARAAAMLPRLDRAQLQARSQHDTWARLTDVTVLVLVCAGRYDGIAPVHNSQELARRIPGAQLRVFDGGHIFLAQDPAAPAAIRDFLLAPDALTPAD